MAVMTTDYPQGEIDVGHGPEDYSVPGKTHAKPNTGPAIVTAVFWRGGGGRQPRKPSVEGETATAHETITRIVPTNFTTVAAAMADGRR